MALPINGAMEILNAIIETGSADSVVSKISKSRPLLGITGASVKVGDPYYDQNQEYFAERDGVLILGISETGAAINDVKVGDILTSFNGLPIISMEDLTNVLYTCKPGQTVTLGLWRNGEDVTVTVTFEQRK
jgi:S1-C subfamily serine protease